ncbi:Uncharacterised protein [Niallia circulans]|nr:Uncharacterised protein [Niallia circulans]
MLLKDGLCIVSSSNFAKEVTYGTILMLLYKGTERTYRTWVSTRRSHWHFRVKMKRGVLQ